MDVPAVRGIAKTLSSISDMLIQIARVLEVLLSALKTTAFYGLVGASALAQYLDEQKPYIQYMAVKLAELSNDLSATIDAYERGDSQGATRFY